MTIINRTDLLRSSLIYDAPATAAPMQYVRLQSRPNTDLWTFLHQKQFHQDASNQFLWFRDVDRYSSRLAGILAAQFDLTYVSTREDITTERDVKRWLSCRWEWRDFPAGSRIAFPVGKGEKPEQFYVITISEQGS